MSRLFNGVLSSWLMFARNSLLYLDESASCAAFSSTARRASSTSLFFCSTALFCSTSSDAFSSSSSLTCCSSSCCSRSISSEDLRVCACCSSSWLDLFSSFCCRCSSLDCSFSSSARDCDCFSSSSVRMFAPIMLRTTPMLSVSCSRNSRWMDENGSKLASSITARTSSSKRTGSTMRLSGGASPRPDVTWM